jgi:hypothetical protein
MNVVMMSAGLAMLVLAGCTGSGQNQGAGFTGLGSEATSVSRAMQPVGTVPATGAALLPDLPRSQVRANTANRLGQAELAIRNGGSFGRHAKRVSIGGETLALSIVDVNTTPFAVLRAPGALFSPAINPAAGAALQSQARALTGCAADSRTYFYGATPDRPIGLAVALYCR